MSRASPVLSTFPEEIQWTEEEKSVALQSDSVRQVLSFALGPEGTNIAQAAREWHRVNDIVGKADTVLCDLPENALRQAEEVIQDGVVPIFWTCAVFARMKDMFFQNPHTLPFFFVHEMKLDEMQLAAHQRHTDALLPMLRGESGGERRIASHVSPAPLLEPLRDFGAVIVDAPSNAAAAEKCAAGEVDACMTTTAARERYGLTSLHVFGSPPMLFFGGTTSHGLSVLSHAV